MCVRVRVRVRARLSADSHILLMIKVQSSLVSVRLLGAEWGAKGISSVAPLY